MTAKSTRIEWWINVEKRCLAGTLETLISGCHCVGCDTLREAVEELKIHEKRMSLAELDLLILRYLMRQWDVRWARVLAMDRLDQADLGAAD
mgnify:FL=1